ncbi:MAG: SIS domain-containing protein [Erysipelotrichaceae bacterium]|nr:SIS domain-containing protein [Erysipelotrichaceae bacterium]
MTKIDMNYFYGELNNILDRLEKEQGTNIVKAAEICAQTMMHNGVVHVFGSGHSVGVGLELRNRVGSLVPFHHIRTDDFVIKGFTTLEDFKNPNDVFERRSGISQKMYDMYNVQKNDAFIIISNSGINGLVIDMALKAKAEGQKVIVMTSMQHTTAEPSRHPSGKKLYELGDVVIDNCGPQGDALIETGKLEKICSISSITGAFIAQAIVTEICRIMEENHYEIPVLYSTDVEGYAEHNRKLNERYARCE